MIEREGSGYILRCDYCSNYVDDLEDFARAVEYKKANGWVSNKIDNEWFDMCPECLEKGDKLL